MSVQVSAELLFSRWCESTSNAVFLVWSLDLAACAGTLAETYLVIKVVQFCVSSTKNLLSGARRNRVSAAQVPLA